MLESPETLHRKEVWVRRARKHLPFYPAGLEDEDVPRQISSFVISINATKGLQLPLIAVGKAYRLKYEVTLFHRQFGFFGRTYGGCPHAVKLSAGSYSTDSSDYVFFSASCSCENIEAVVELVAYEVDAEGKRAASSISVGWTHFSLGSAHAEPKPVPATNAATPSKILSQNMIIEIYTGSPRTMLFPTAKYHIVPLPTRGSAKLEYRVAQVRALPELRRLLPINCLCGPWDVLPGILGDHLPRGPEVLLDGVSSELKLLPAYHIYINNCVVKLPHQLEARLQKNIATEYEVPESDVVFSERRLRLAAHNQWTFVNSARLKNSIALSLDDDLLRCNGIPTIDSVFVSPYIALIFQIEYTLGVRRGGTISQTVTLSLGEAAALLDLTHQFESQDIAVPLHSEPERSLSSGAFWTPDEILPGEDWAMTLVCEASVKQGTMATQGSAEILAAMQERRKLEEAHTKQLQELIEKETELKSRASTFGPRQDTKSRPDLGETAAPQERVAKTAVSIYSNLSRTKPEGKKGTARPQPHQAAGVVEGRISARTKTTSVILTATPGSLRNVLSKRDETAMADLLTSDSGTEPTGFPAAVYRFGIADIEDDRLDTLKAATVFFEFIAFKPRGTAADNADLMPRKVAFSFKFFSFPETRTEAVSFKPASNGVFLLELAGKVKGWTNFSGRHPDGRTLRSQFNFDPTADRDVLPDKALDDFLRYLAGNVCKVWVYDAESRIPFGSCMVCLADLLRRREPMKTVKKEYSVFSEERELAGTLQLALQNVGRKVAPKSKPAESEIVPGASKPSHKGKTKLKSKPLQMEDLARVPQLSLRVQGNSLLYGKGDMLPSEERRKAEIVYAYRMRQQQGATNSQRESLMDDVGKYRTVSRTMALASLVEASDADEGLDIPNKIVYTIGEISLYPILFSSPQKFDALLACFLHDPDARNELQLVTDPNEWKYYCKRGHFLEPPDWTMLADRTRFMMKGQEQVQLVTRLLALAPPVRPQRAVSVTVQNVQTQATELASEVRLIYKETYYNSCYQFCVPENRSADLVLMPEVHPSVVGKAKCVKCSNQNAEVRLKNGLIYLTFVAPASPRDTEIYVVLYGDEYFYETLCVFYVVARSYTCIDVSDTAGKRVLQHIAIDNFEKGTRTLRLCSGNSNMVRLGENAGKAISLGENQSVSIPVNVGSCRIGESQVLLHAVGNFSCIIAPGIDEDTGKIYKRWVFRFRTEPPTNISQKFDVDAPAGRDLQATFMYENAGTVPQKRTYELASSRPDVLRVLLPSVTLDSGEKMPVPVVIRLPERKAAKIVQALVYVTEMATGKVDAVLFNINPAI